MRALDLNEIEEFARLWALISRSAGWMDNNSVTQTLGVYIQSSKKKIMKDLFKKTIRRIPGIKWLLDIRRELSLIRFQTTQQTRIHQQLYRETIRIIRLNEGMQFPVSYEHQTFSQNGEDGILSEILKRIDLECGRFIEIGSGDGLENNTRLLLENGWEGLWIDGSQSCCSFANEANLKFIKNGQLKIINSFVTASNINQILKNMKVAEDIDVLSLDVDLNTYHVWEKIDVISPTIAIIEYNGFSQYSRIGLQTMTKKGFGKEDSIWDHHLSPLMSSLKRKAID